LEEAILEEKGLSKEEDKEKPIMGKLFMQQLAQKLESLSHKNRQLVATYIAGMLKKLPTKFTNTEFPNVVMGLISSLDIEEISVVENLLDTLDTK